MHPSRRFDVLEKLESRFLLSAAYPTVYEQYMVELYNWARANPSAAATKYNVALNEGPPDTAISADAKQPLAINPYLTDGARDFAQWMIDHDQFGHYVDGSNPQARMTSAGYSFGSSWGYGENLALYSSSGMPDQTTTVERHFSNLYTDLSIAGRGHRVNMMNPSWKEIGSGIASGPYNGWNTIISAQDFAYSGSGSFLTGVAYKDTSHDNLYSPGEQLAGVTVTAIRSSDNQMFTTTSWTSGGYTLALPAGTYTVWGSGGSLGGYVKFSDVTIGSINVKKDFRPDYVNSSTGPGTSPPTSNAFAFVAGGKLTVNGTSATETITLSLASGTLSVTRGEETLTFTASTVKSIVISAGNGNDTVTIGAGIIGASIYGGNGNDSITGGAGADMLKGDTGNDTINGGNGADKIYGGAGSDRLLGGSHADSIYGEAGADSLYGQNQNDFLDGGINADYLSGGKDTDTVDYSTRTASVFVELTNTSAQPTNKSGEAGENDNVLTDIENINGGTGSDRLIGSASVNEIRGNAGNDTLYGLAGADQLFGGDGKDRFFAIDSTRDKLDGGAGADIASIDTSDVLTSIESH